MSTVTINGTDYPSYATLEYAIQYLSASIEATDFLAATATVQSQALVSMTRTIDRQSWQGTQTDGYEDAAFPRTGLYYRDGTPVDANSVPVQVEDACCEGAAQLVSGGTFMDAATTFNYQKVIKAGSVSVENFRQIGRQPRFPQVIQELIGLWLGGALLPLGSESTGTDKRTIFNELYDLTTGF